MSMNGIAFPLPGDDESDDEDGEFGEGWYSGDDDVGFEVEEDDDVVASPMAAAASGGGGGMLRSSMACLFSCWALYRSRCR